MNYYQKIYETTDDPEIRHMAKEFTERSAAMSPNCKMDERTQGRNAASN